MSNKTRELIFERASSSGKLLVRYYDTGCIVGFNSDNLERTKGGEGGIFRVNNLFHMDPSDEEITAIIEKLDRLAPYEYIFSVDVSSPPKAQVVRDYLAFEEADDEERLLALSALLSNLTFAAHEVSFAESLELVSRNRENLSFARESNSLPFMASRYLNLIPNPEVKRGRLTNDQFKSFWQLEEMLEQHRIFKNFVKDFEERVPLVGLERRKCKRYDDHVPSLRMEFADFFPHEGFHELHNRLLNNEVSRVMLDSGLSQLTYHALKVDGSSRASEFVRVVQQEIINLQMERAKGDYPAYRFYTYLSCYMNEFLKSLGDEMTVETLLDAIEDTSIPFDLAILVS